MSEAVRTDGAAPPTEAQDLDPAGVAAWLARHPRFLADRPALYRALTPPARVHGEVLADHMAAMITAERTHGAAMAARADGVVAAGRAAAGLAARVQGAVLALIAAADVAECIATELPALLAMDTVSLCVEAPWPGTRALPPGSVARLLGGRAALLRDGPGDDAIDRAALHGEAAALACVDALIRVPLETPALLALGARHADVLDPAQGSGALIFLGRVIAAVWLR